VQSGPDAGLASYRHPRPLADADGSPTVLRERRVAMPYTWCMSRSIIARPRPPSSPKISPHPRSPSFRQLSWRS